MENQNLSPDEQDIDSFSTPVQNFAFGGIANPAQRAFLRGSDKQYLDERQKELDAFEQQRLAYNDQLTKWQNEVYKPYQAQVDAFNAGAQKYNEEVYNPYKAQVDAYNAELAKYNEEVYNPYKTQFSEYEKAVNAWNEGDRTTDYAGPAAPTLAREFSLTAPTEPAAFGMAQPTAPEDFKGTAPVLPFKEEEVQAYQQDAANRARKDAASRAVAIDVVSNPDQFNFGSMSVANRFMAKGGEVKAKGKSAKEMLGEMDGGYEPDDAAILKMAQEISSKGKLSHKQIMEAVDRVAAAGRGGDELLAYLSPASVEILKKMGGSGSINPATGLHEFKGGVVGKIVNAVKRVFGGGSSKSAAPATPAEPASQRVQMEYETIDQGDSTYSRPTGRYFIPQYSMDGENQVMTGKTYVDSKYVTAVDRNEGDNTYTEYMYRAPAPVAPEATTPAATTPAAATPTGPTAAELLKQIEEANAAKAAAEAKYAADLKAQQESAAQPQPASKDTASVKPGSAYYESPEYKAFMKANSDPMIARDMAMYRSQYFGEVGSMGLGREMDKAYESYLERVAREAKEAPPTSVAPPPVITPPPPPPPPVVRDPRSAGTIQGPAGSSAQLVNRTVSPLQATTPAAAMLNTLNAANPLAKVDLSGRISSPTGGRTQQPGMQPVARGPENSSGGDIPITAPTMPVYSDRGVGAVGDVGGIRIQGPSMPVFGNERLTMGGAATNPSSYFGMSQPSTPGINAGTTAIGSPDMPMYGAMNTMGAIGANPNLSPTMLGGVENAGYMTDRLGNRIYAPGMGPLFGPPGFAKGGLADVNEFNMADAEDEEPINTDPAGSARKLLADLTGPTQSVTEVTESPNAKSIKRVSKKTSGGGGGTPKGMSMEYEALTSAKDLVPQLKDDGSARSQMEALALAYKLRAQQATDKSRGLMRNTLGAPTLEQPTLTKGRLTAKRFEKGGEAKKSMGGETEVSASEGLPAPGLMNATIWADTVSREMYPSDREYTKRDAARHMLAAAIMANKTSPGIAEGLGKFHEFKEAPFRTAGHWLGVSEPRGDYRTDVHNNALGAALAEAAKDPRQLERMVRQAIKGGSSTGIEKGRVSLTPDDLSNMGYGGIQPGVAVSQERMRRKTEQEPAKRAEGSPEEGEIGPAFVTPKSGKGRKEGEISRQLKSGDAYVNMAKGVTELPYDLAGAPVDLATMLMRPFGYSTERPVMGSDWIKEKMTGAGVRPEPPADPTAKGFYTAGELLSNLTNPAGVARKAGPVVEKGVKAGAKEVGRQLDRAIMDNAGPLANLVPQAAKPLYAVRPTGSTMLSGPVGMEQNVSKIDQLLQSGISNSKSAAGQDQAQEAILQNFWDKKARNYFTRQFGTPDDPIATAISKKQIKGTALDEMFPEYLIDQLAVGKTRVNEQGQERFFPKYPRAMEDFTSRYDKATGIKGNLITTDPAAANPKYGSLLSDEGRLQGLLAETAEQDKLLAQGMRPELINTDVGAVTRSAVDPTKIIGDGTDSAKALFNAYEEANQFKQLPEPEQTNWINKLFGEGRRILGKNEQEVGQNLLPENVRTAIAKGEPVYDVGFMRAPLTELFNPASINKYLASIPPREAANIRFEDAVKGSLKLKEKAAELENVVGRIKAGKPVADTVFSRGVSGPLLQIKEGPLEGFAWKRIEKREATVPEGAYVGHSVGGYETGGATYTQDKREGFNTGKWQVYTLRDNRNRPVNTIEVKMLDEDTPVVTQIKGNGRATGNTAPEKYDEAVVQFLQNYLKPAAIEESDSYLTPLLQTYKANLGPSPRTR